MTPAPRPRPALATAAWLAVAVACRGPGDASPAPSAAVDSAFTHAGRPVPPALVNAYVAAREGFTSRGGEVRCAYVPLGQAGDRIFVNTLCVELVRDGDSLDVGSGRGGPVALRVAADGDSVRVVSHEVPADGGGHAASVRRIFPPDVVARILAPAPRAAPLEAHLRAAVRRGAA